MATAAPTHVPGLPQVPAAVLDGGPPRHRVASFPPPIAENPYQRLLYEALESHGLDLVVGNRLKLDWLWRSRRQPTAATDRGAASYGSGDTGPASHHLGLDA